MTSNILFFDAICADDLPMVGGKGANLGELTRAGFNVPPGFCVTTDAFARFMAAATEDVYPRLDELSGEDLEQLRRVGNKVRTILEGVSLPAEVEAAVVEAWQELGEGYAYAVRSSATAEDLPHASFAGQHDTYLNVCGQASLLTSVKSCFVSLFTDRAILYRVQNGFDHREVALSVVVQRMVEPDAAGILFTADPISGNRNIASIDASFGLGEALVSGIVSADLYQVDRRANRVVKRQLATKEMSIRSLADGGTEQVALSERERTQPALTDAQVLEIARLGNQIESYYGKPQDIEWALVDERLYITQSRPITSLYPLPEPRPDDDDLHIYVSFSHFQVMTDAMRPLALSMLRVILPVGHAEGQIESKRVQTAGGRFYVDLSPILRNPLGRRILPKAYRNADMLAASALKALAERPEFLAKGERLRSVSLLSIFGPFFLKTLRILFWSRPEGATDEVLTVIDAYVAGVKTRLDAAPDLPARLTVARAEIPTFFRPIFTWAPHLAAGMMASVLLHVFLRDVGDTEERAAVGRGLEGNVATEMNLAVGDLADAARVSDELVAHLSQTDIDAATRLASAATLPGGAEFLQAWNHFLQIYGARGPAEIDLSRPRWSEDPSSLLQMVVNALGQEEEGAHWAHYNRLVAEGEQAGKTLVTAAHKGWWGWVRGPIVRRLVRVSRNLMPLREHHKFFVMQLLALVKPILIEAGRQLEAAGRLESGEDVWFLTFPDVLEAMRNSELQLRTRVAEEQNKFERYQQLTPPRVMTSDGEIPVLKLEGTGAPAGALVGSPVSAGVVEGIARVVLDPAVGVLEPGEILVAPFTDPGWTPLFVNAAGLITEVGGLMTHGSLVAREYGIPAVVGVLDATTLIQTGQRVRVHGDVGYVEVLGDGESSD